MSAVKISTNIEILFLKRYSYVSKPWISVFKEYYINQLYINHVLASLILINRLGQE